MGEPKVELIPIPPIPGEDASRTRARAPSETVLLTKRLADLRRSIPAELYVQMLHSAALTGMLPRLDPTTGRPLADADGNMLADPVSGEDRIKLLGLLLGKVLPKASDLRPDLLDAHTAPPASLVNTAAGGLAARFTKPLHELTEQEIRQQQRELETQSRSPGAG